MSPTGPNRSGDVLILSMGDKGVHITSGPLHSELGDLLYATNASFFGQGQRGGISKRMGLQALTTSACAGQIHAIYPIMFTDPTPGASITDDATAVLTDDAFEALIE